MPRAAMPTCASSRTSQPSPQPTSSTVDGAPLVTASTTARSVTRTREAMAPVRTAFVHAAALCRHAVRMRDSCPPASSWLKLLQPGAAEVVGVLAEPHHARLLVEVHVPNGAARAGDIGDAGERFAGGVERHEAIGHAALGDPDHAVVVQRRAVGARALAAGKLPLLELAGGGIVAAEITAGVVGIPYGAVASDLEPPRPRLETRQLDEIDLEARRVDRGEVMAAEQRHPRAAVVGDLDAVGTRVRLRRGDEVDFARGHVQPADVVAALGGEPDVAGAVEDHGVGVAHVAVGQLKAGDLARGRVEAADVGVSVGGEPDHPLVVDDEVVGSGAVVEIVLREFAGRRVEAADVAAGLAAEPHRAV